jgi:hypothetical protein
MPSTLYWQAMVRLPPLKTDQENWELTTTVLSSNGEREEKTIVPLLYECQNTPCLAFEQHVCKLCSQFPSYLHNWTLSVIMLIHISCPFRSTSLLPVPNVGLSSTAACSAYR